VRTWLTVVVAALAVGLASGCEPATIQLGFTPHRGAVYRYRYEVTINVDSRLGDVHRRRRDVTTIDARLEVLSTSGDHVRVAVALVRDGAPAPRLVVRLDRGEQLSAVELIDGSSLVTLGLADLATSGTLELPHARLTPGDRWHREHGEGKLDRLGVVDGHDVAVVTSRRLDPLRRTTDEQVNLVGDQRTEQTTRYDLADGAVRTSTSRTTGHLRVTARPPVGIDASPVRGSLRYSLVVQTARA
jgi:hypothetical protein